MTFLKDVVYLYKYICNKNTFFFLSFFFLVISHHDCLYLAVSCTQVFENCGQMARANVAKLAIEVYPNVNTGLM